MKNEWTAKAYFYLGCLSNTKEEEIKYYNESIMIYNKCNIENEKTALAYFCLGNANETKEERLKIL